MFVTFDKIRYKNILSTGNHFTEIDFTKSKTTLVVGMNGVGKSTIIEALSFGLYNRPFRKINKPQLVNSINEKQLLVEIDVRANGKKYMIRRGIKPSVFEIYCNGKLVNQDAAVRDYQHYLETNIIRMDYKTFGQIVVLGNATYVPFMQLPAAHRRDIVEDLLNIQVFTVMHNLLKEKISTNRAKIVETQQSIDNFEQQIIMINEHIETVSQKDKKVVEKKLADIEELRQQNKQHAVEIEHVSKQIEQQQQQITDSSKTKKEIDKIRDLRGQLNHKIADVEHFIEFYKQHDNCPTCKQEIDEQFKQDAHKSKEQKKQELAKAITELDEKYDAAAARLQQIGTIQQQINQLNQQLQQINNTISSNNRIIDRINDEISAIENDKSYDDQAKQKLLQTRQQLKNAKQRLTKQKYNRQLYDSASILLKDGGIKTKIIKQVIPVINKLINKYLATLDFFVQFELNENFEETIRSRYRDVFSYSSFSEGEKARINLCLLLAWRSISRIRNSVATNLLVLDEVFDSSMDSEGVDNLIKIFDEFDSSYNLFVITHKPDQYQDRFERILAVEKKGNFSSVAERTS